MWIKTKDGKSVNLSTASVIEIVEPRRLTVKDRESDTDLVRVGHENPVFSVRAKMPDGDDLLLLTCETREKAQAELDKINAALGVRALPLEMRYNATTGQME
jgi:hypothetical protein